MQGSGTGGTSGGIGFSIDTPLAGDEADVGATLKTAAARLRVPVHGFFIGEIPEVALTHRWILGPRDYEQTLTGLAGSSRCAMWCCVDDVCLSYRLALPNKFFQALAALMPVIVAPGTYLADIVREHGVGYVFDGGNLKDIVEALRGDDYFGKAAAVESLRTGLELGKVEL